MPKTISHTVINSVFFSFIYFRLSSPGWIKYLSKFPSFFSPGPDGQEVLLVTVPDFSSTQTACLVNLRTLECEPVTFLAFSAADDEEESEMNISH